MTKQNNLFLATLDALHKSGAFEYIILIGSWCHHFYRVYFNNAPEIPVVRTMDIDFLIPNPAKIHKDINIPEILRTLDFTPTHSYTTGYTKYEHPELELEFLTPELNKNIGTDTYLSAFFLGLPFGLNLKSLLSCPSSPSIKSFDPRGRPVLVFSLIPFISSGLSGASINFFHSFGSFSI